MSTPFPGSESDIFARVVSADEALPAGIARTVLAWKFPIPDLKLLEKLQKKNNAGTLNDIERRQLENYVRVGQFVSIMQAQARLSISR